MRGADFGTPWPLCPKSVDYHDILTDRIGRPTVLVRQNPSQTNACPANPEIPAADAACCMIETDTQRWPTLCDDVCTTASVAEAGGSTPVAPCPAWCGHVRDAAWPKQCEPTIAKNAEPIWLAKYEPYGKILEEKCRAPQDSTWGECGPGSLTIELRAPGQYHDRETGLYYNGQRYFVPELYRFNAPEPIGQAGSLDLYMYAGGNPVMMVDPTGEFAFLAIAAAPAAPVILPTALVIGVAAGLAALTYYAIEEVLRAEPVPHFDETFDEEEPKPIPFASPPTINLDPWGTPQPFSRPDKKDDELDTTPIFYVCQDRTPEIYDYTRNAIIQYPELEWLTHDGPPGLPGSQYERLRQIRIRERRLNATRGLVCNSKQQKDEYPYACTFQGGLGAFVKCVPDWENSKQGGDLSSFITSYYRNNGPVPLNFRVLTVPSGQYCPQLTGNIDTRR